MMTLLVERPSRRCLTGPLLSFCINRCVYLPLVWNARRVLYSLPATLWLAANESNSAHSLGPTSANVGLMTWRASCCTRSCSTVYTSSLDKFVFWGVSCTWCDVSLHDERRGVDSYSQTFIGTDDNMFVQSYVYICIVRCHYCLVGRPRYLHSSALKSNGWDELGREERR